VTVPDDAPRLAASVLLLRDDPLEVLMVERPARGAFASAVAFPGGSVDAEDGDPSDGTDAALRAAAVRETAEETGIALPDPAALVPFARWVTPREESRRFDAAFFAVRSPADAVAAVDGRELVTAAWVTPAEALRRGDAGEWLVVPPTRFQLLRLAQHARVEEVLDAARALPLVVTNPEILTAEDGRRLVRIPAGGGYPVTEVEIR
jgi:8-oxo-dGTP pyrophosphatase MutT (NUDIX family)